jgi:hypothetical protein
MPIAPVIPADSTSTLSTIATNSNLVTMYGKKLSNNFAHRILDPIGSYAGSISTTSSLSSLITVPDSTRYVIIQSKTNPILIQFNSTSNFGLSVPADEIFCFPGNSEEIEKIYIYPSSATSIVIELFKYDC